MTSTLTPMYRPAARRDSRATMVMGAFARPRKPRRWRYLVGLLLLAAAGVGLSRFVKPAPPKEERPRPVEREVTTVPGTRLAAICGSAPFTGFHFCNYGLSDTAIGKLEAAGAVIAAHAPDAGVEAFEVPAHPFFVATLFQPQMAAVDGVLHPLIATFAQEAGRVRMVG